MRKKLDFSNEGADEIVLGYAIFKRSDGVVVGAQLQKFISLLKVLPVSSADCERGFGQMNLYHKVFTTAEETGCWSHQLVEINGPSLEMWNAEKNVGREVRWCP